ncbi:hypothetical protein GOV11_03970 [Candidatus Woesearchaeota archaeon]|nr:hypothetical protein [Candidatus Woesearchaeota archaeon]
MVVIIARVPAAEKSAFPSQPPNVRWTAARDTPFFIPDLIPLCVVSYEEAKAEPGLRQEYLDGWLEDNPCKAVPKILYLPNVKRKDIPPPYDTDKLIKRIWKSKNGGVEAEFSKPRGFVLYIPEIYGKMFPHPVFATQFLFDRPNGYPDMTTRNYSESLLHHETIHSKDAMYGMKVGRSVVIDYSNIDDLTPDVFHNAGEVRANLAEFVRHMGMGNSLEGTWSKIEAQNYAYDMRDSVDKENSLDLIVSKVQSRILDRTIARCE